MSNVPIRVIFQDLVTNILPCFVPSILFSSIVHAPDFGSNIDHFIRVVVAGTLALSMQVIVAKNFQSPRGYSLC